MRIAVIDIGSNSIRYMEATRTESGFTFSEKSVHTTRLAEGLVESGRLSEHRMKQSLHVLQSLAERAHNNALPCFCYATSAVRDASNRDLFLADIHAHSALQVEVLSGEQEALFARLGTDDPSTNLIDIGGGSSQIITDTYRKSFPIGCVRVKDMCGDASLESMRSAMYPKFFETYVIENLPRDHWTAVGGTATTLAAYSLGLTHYNANRIKEAKLSQNDLWKLLQDLDSMGSAARAKHPLLSKRHDVICCGGLILQFLMEHIGMEAIRFSDADGLEGYAKHQLRLKK